MARRALWAFVGVLGCATHRLPPTATARVDVVDLSRPLRFVERTPDETTRVLCGGLRGVHARWGRAG